MFVIRFAVSIATRNKALSLLSFSYFSIEIIFVILISFSFFKSSQSFRFKILLLRGAWVGFEYSNRELGKCHIFHTFCKLRFFTRCSCIYLPGAEDRGFMCFHVCYAIPGCFALKITTTPHNKARMKIGQSSKIAPTLYQ